ncbi:hypothetical protein OSTOST_05246, partial [Ostertagia ostertagi]
MVMCRPGGPGGPSAPSGPISPGSPGRPTGKFLSQLMDIDASHRADEQQQSASSYQLGLMSKAEPDKYCTPRKLQNFLGGDIFELKHLLAPLSRGINPLRLQMLQHSRIESYNNSVTLTVLNELHDSSYNNGYNSHAHLKCVVDE